MLQVGILLGRVACRVQAPMIGKVFSHETVKGLMPLHSLQSAGRCFDRNGRPGG
jgi:hypothetical protein